MAIFNGTDLILKVSPSNGGTAVKLMHSQTVSLSVNTDTIDISTKDSAGFRDLIGGQKSFSLSADGLMDFATGGSDTELDELFTQMLARTAVTFVFGIADASAYNMSGSGFITSIEVSGGTEDAPTYSVSIEGTGTLTVG
jgi:TP901-1 family phage major tail protein